jgi:NTP pyrophosphatase (non-canonical NTP hydrolase)
MDAILESVITELDLAKAKWPDWPVDPVHAAAVVSEEAGELVQAANDFCYSGGNLDRMKAEAIQTVAMGLRFLDGLAMYERRKGY